METIFVLMFLSVMISHEIMVYACMAEATCHSMQFLPWFSEVLGVLRCCYQVRDKISEGVYKQFIHVQFH